MPGGGIGACCCGGTGAEFSGHEAACGARKAFGGACCRDVAEDAAAALNAGGSTSIAESPRQLVESEWKSISGGGRVVAVLQSSTLRARCSF